MKKQDEIDFFNELFDYCISNQVEQPGMDVIDNFDMNPKRKVYILTKWSEHDIWRYNKDIKNGMFHPNPVDAFVKFNELKPRKLTHISDYKNSTKVCNKLLIIPCVILFFYVLIILVIFSCLYLKME